MTFFVVLSFWVCVLAVGWTYAGYPLLLLIIRRFRSRVSDYRDHDPSVSLIITAYNEEKDIGEKLRMCLSLSYPKQKLNIVVASDKSTDRTHEIVRSFEEDGVGLLVLEERGGKTAAQNAAVKHATGEIIVFTDASTEFDLDTIQRLVSPFSDPRVGCVAAELEYVSDAKTGIGKGAGAYWRYERWIKHLESETSSLIGVSGCLYAIRRDICPAISADMISDFVVASEVYSRGFVTVYGVGALAFEKTLENTAQEFNMRVRVAIRSINALIRYRRMLNPFRYGFFALQLISHKVLRYLVPEFLIAILWLNVAIVSFGSGSSFYEITLWLQLTMYLLALLGWGLHALSIKVPVLHIPFYFLHANIAVLWAQVKYMLGERKTVWTPVR